MHHGTWLMNSSFTEFCKDTLSTNNVLRIRFFSVTIAFFETGFYTEVQSVLELTM